MEEETKDEQREESQDEQGDEGSRTAEQESVEADKKAEEKVAALEDDMPESLEDWPDDQAKYKTFGGPDDESGYEDGPTSKLGASDVRHHDDGTVTVGGEKVDDPDEYKGDPIPGGPTDPNTPKISGEQDLTEEGADDDSGDSDAGDGSETSQDS